MQHNNKHSLWLPPAVALTCVMMIFFTSGACGLMYQVVWTRKLTLLFGTTAYAVSTVLCVFFLGLGIGGFAGGKLADRTRNPLRVYGLFEIVIGVWAALFILALPAVEPVVPLLLRLFDFSRSTGILLRAILTLLLLCVPVTLMGATLPLLSRFVARSNNRLGRHVSAIYAANTFGAVVGCLFTGFILIARLGYTRATFLAALLNVAAGGAALLLSRVTEPLSDDAPCEDRTGCGDVPRTHISESMGILLLAAAVCGFSGLALEVVWTRLLAIVFLGTTYAYTTMLTTFLCGIAIGGACAAWFADRIMRPRLIVGALLTCIAIVTLLMLTWTATLPEHFVEMQRASGADWAAMTRGAFVLSFLTLFPMTFLFGFLFPLILRTSSLAGGRVGSGVGRVYSANTLGGVLGAITGGFVLLPLLGAHRSIEIISMLLFLAGQLLLWRCGHTSRLWKTALAAALLMVYAAVYSVTPTDVSRALNVGYVPSDHHVLFFREGVEGTVVVSEPESAQAGEDRVLWINRVQATTSIERGVKMNRLQGALPLLFERDYPDVLFMCFGSGITCGTLALYDFDRIDAVEISPEVLEAAPMFDKDNLGVLYNPKVHFHIDDGRNYLLRTETRYDVITFEPMPLALAGVSTFYTREYYRLCLDRLKPGGMVSQWVPLHSNDPEMVRSLVRTFIGVFPEYCAFFVNADLFLIGSDAPLRMDYARARERLATPALHHALADADLGDVIEVMACFLFDKSALDSYASGDTVMMDDRPWAEFVAPRLVYERRVPEAIDTIKPHISNPLDNVAPTSITEEAMDALKRRHRSRVNDFDALQLYYGGSMLDDSAATAFIESLRIDPDNENAQYYLKEILRAQTERFMRWGEYGRVIALLEKATPYLPDDSPLLETLRQAKLASPTSSR